VPAATRDHTVRAVLTRLHDLPYLQTHPLGARRGKELQRRLLDGLNELGSGRTAELMRLRYAEALDSREVAERLGISQGEYYREHAVGLAALASLLEEQPAPRSGSAATSGELPRPPSSLVGRDEDVAQIASAIEDARLVTLTGPGGVGKTRLALEVARSLAARFADGVHVVELAPVADPAHLAGAVAARLGVEEPAGQPRAEAIAEHLGARAVLLVLDNCEHLADACAALVGYLQRSCARLRILATSREPLGLPDELVWSVPPLPADEATRLFAMRARAGLREFALTPTNEAAVRRICERLDGLPLAIELAAARVRALGVEETAARLDDRFRLLVGGRGAEARHQTMRAVVDWSHDLLGGSERALFRRLAVFAGGWTLEAAEATCADDELPTAEIVDALARLVDRSLVVADHHTAGGVRYRFLETLRDYAGERLVEAGEDGAQRDRHLGWCLRLAEEAEPGLWGGGEQENLRRLGAEHDNLRAGLAWALDASAGAPERTGGDDAGRVDRRGVALRLAAALSRFWRSGGHHHEGARWLDRALAHEAVEHPARAAALAGAAILARDLRDGERSHELAVEGLELAERLGDHRSAGLALHNLAVLATDPDEVERLTRRALDHYHAVDFASGIGASLVALGAAALFRRDHGRVRGLFEEALRQCRRGGDEQGLTAVYLTLATIALSEGQPDEAWRLIGEALRAAGDSGTQFARVACLGLKAEIALELGRVDEALALLRDGAELASRTPRWFPLLPVHWLGVLALRRGEPSRGVRLMGAASRSLADMRHAHSPLYWDFARVDASVREARAAFPEDDFAAAWAAGEAMTAAEAVAYALEEPG
jgi:predicted ATPase